MAAAALMALLAAEALAVTFPLAAPNDVSALEGGTAGRASKPRGGTDALRETVIGGYVGIPDHLRSDVHIVRPDGTDMTLKALRWDAEPFSFPLYAGVRATRWTGPFGGMIDFLHDKAVTRVGKGAHGRKVTGERAIPDIIETTGTLKGMPSPSPVAITGVIERLEFSHGHNMLMPTFLLRLGAIAPRLRPYFGIGAGVAIPHVEFWPLNEGEAAKTNEYQAAGPAMQVVAGLEWQGPRGPAFLEYKFTWASLSTSLTGGKTPAWCNCDIVSDFARQAMNWWRGVEPAYGHLSTTILTNQVVAGAGYRLGSGAPAAAVP
ncbi:MAG: lipid A oxidase [Hyphomicrobium sp.]